MARKKKPAKRSDESYFPKRPRLATGISRSDIVKSMLKPKSTRKKKSVNIVNILSDREMSGRNTLKKKINTRRMKLIDSDKKRIPNNHLSNNGYQMN